MRKEKLVLHRTHDLMFASALLAKGKVADIVFDETGRGFFVFNEAEEEYAKLEKSFYSNGMKLSAFKVLAAHRELKNMLYAKKGEINIQKHG